VIFFSALSQLAKNVGVKFMETSARTGINVKEV
jgi:hypothetical protein